MSIYLNTKNTDLHFTVILQATFHNLWNLENWTCRLQVPEIILPILPFNEKHTLSSYLSTVPKVPRKKSHHLSQTFFANFAHSNQHIFVGFKPLELENPSVPSIHPSTVHPHEPGAGVRSIRALLSASLRCGVCVVLSCIRGEGEASTRGLGLDGPKGSDTRWQFTYTPGN